MNSIRFTFPWVILAAAALFVLPSAVAVPQGQAAAQGIGAEKKDAPKRAFTPEEMKEINQQGKIANKNGWRFGADHKVGRYYGITKLILLNVIFWLWVATTSWVNNDTQLTIDLNRYRWNTIMLVVFPTAFLIGLCVPIFWATLPIALLGWLVPVLIYVAHRNHGRLKAEKVMTADHIGYLIKRTLRMSTAPKKAIYEVGAPIQFSGWGKSLDKQTQMGRGIVARNTPGYNPLRALIYKSIQFNIPELKLENQGMGVNIQLLVDGIWHPWKDLLAERGHEDLTVDEVRSMIATVKTLCGCRPSNLPRQSGQFLAQYGVKQKAIADCTIQANATAEQAHIVIQFQALPFDSLAGLGMNPDREAEVKKMINLDKGLVILSAAPRQGLRTMTNVTFDSADRFTRDFVTVEDVNKPYMTIENIQVVSYDSSKKESPMTVLPDVFFKEAKVLLLRDPVNVESLKLCCDEIKNERLIITTFRGVDSVDTILRMLKFIDRDTLAGALTYVLNQRLVRRLCPECKEAIPAPAQVLRQLGLPASIETIYRKRVHTVVPGQKDTYEPCPHCLEIGYKGRAGIYDGIVINDEIRQLIRTNPDPKLLRQAAVRAKCRGFLSDAARLVADGTTSYEELVRVMKG